MWAPTSLQSIGFLVGFLKSSHLCITGRCVWRVCDGARGGAVLGVRSRDAFLELGRACDSDAAVVAVNVALLLLLLLQAGRAVSQARHEAQRAAGQAVAERVHAQAWELSGRVALLPAVREAARLSARR